MSGSTKRLGNFALAAALFGVGADYYGTHHYKSFPIDENTKCYLIDARPIGKPGVYVGSEMSEAAGSLTFFFPRNGQIFRARPVRGSENWVQLLSGSYAQTKHCGIEVMREVPCPANIGTRNCVWGPKLEPLSPEQMRPSR